MQSYFVPWLNLAHSVEKHSYLVWVTGSIREPINHFVFLTAVLEMIFSFSNLCASS